MFLKLLAIATFSCICQSIVANNCTLRVDSIQVQPNFTLERYLGRWYELKWFSDRYEAPGEMYQDYTQFYSKRPDGNITITSHGRDPANGHGCLQFHSSMILTDTPGKMFYNYFNKGKLADYWVVKTDYIN
ncbi:apolipoprotein D-like [Crassostrea angulata]|uniref:apolipoprotein D-like n=1 Tax=Magallana angulata TaxID=2784310 RepID=UPI0022B16B85|nr:apolipoprotein D-like [Crassostrea angulata]